MKLNLDGEDMAYAFHKRMHKKEMDNMRRRTTFAHRDVSRFGKLLRLRREAAGLTQTELAILVGVAGQTVNNWENGRSEPSNRRQHAVWDALGDPGLQLNPVRRWGVIDRALEEME